ncbi:hypothetical protein AB0P12_07595 [Streptomyces subrutilus]|uniref:hypothetical protein n=1 Tax=Streptomyces subrutilus TaxID=36818 RepID=UPI0034261DFB
MSEKIGGMSAHEPRVTVRCPDRAEPARLGSRAAARELKVTHIVLGRGRMTSQPMPTLPDRDGHRRLLPELRAAGFDPVRVKVETVPWTAEPAGPGGGCFEHHLKLRLPGGFDRSALEALVTPHGRTCRGTPGGRRMVPPRSVPGPPAGQVQLDFVCNEHLPVGPEPVALGCGAVVLAATPALSLAWKLLWIISDGHPQGKDLHHAALLAERYALPHVLLQGPLNEGPGQGAGAGARDGPDRTGRTGRAAGRPDYWPVRYFTVRPAVQPPSTASSAPVM